MKQSINQSTNLNYILNSFNLFSAGDFAILTLLHSMALHAGDVPGGWKLYLLWNAQEKLSRSTS